MTVKMTLFFNQQGAGFSETYYLNLVDVPFAVGQVRNFVFQAAARFRHISCIIKGVRFSDADPAIKESTLVIPYPKAQGTRFTGDELGADVASTSAVYQLRAADGHKRLVWCRGLADADVIRDEFGNDVESAALRSDRTNYFRLLEGVNAAIQYEVLPPNAGKLWSQVLAVSNETLTNPNRSMVIFTIPPPPMLIGNYFHFTGIPSTLPRFPRKARFLGTKTVAGVVGHLIAYQLPGGIQVDPANMRGTNHSYDYASIINSSFVRFGEHKTGRPFGALRGRSSGVRVA